jgi:hypothetical protein
MAFSISPCGSAFFFGYRVRTGLATFPVTTVVEYIHRASAMDTQNVFWLTGPSQCVWLRSTLPCPFYVNCSVFPSSAVIICGLVVLAYTVLGGYWAVCFTDMFQFVFLFLSLAY